MKISKLVLLIIVSCVLWGCVTNASSADTAKDWGNIALNSNVFKLPIILRNNYHNNICYKGRKNRFNLITTNRVKINPNLVGAFVTNYPVIMQAKQMLVGIHIIPYLVNKINANRHYLIPNFGWITGQIPPFSRFYPACHSMDQKAAKIANRLNYYPLILLKVAGKKQGDLLVKHLQNLNFQARHLGEASAKIRTISKLIQNIFQTKRAKFLEGLPFNVCLQLLDEKNVLRNKIEFAVMNDKSLHSPCNSPNRHKLIVVSLTKFSKQQQTAIRESLINVLSTLKRNHLQVSLRTIQAGRELSTALLTSAELENTKFIKAKIGNLQFGATDLIALSDLGLVDSIIQEQENSNDSIGKVLYITDNANLNGKPPNKQRGVILAWHEDKIRLTVLTTAECRPWNDYMKAQCNSWRTRKQLQNALKKFLY